MGTALLKQPIKIIETNDPNYTVYVTKNGEIFNLTGVTLKFVVKASESTLEEDAYFTYTNGSGISITDPTNGVAEIFFDHDDLPPPGAYWYYLEATFTDLRQATLSYGQFVVADI